MPAIGIKKKKKAADLEGGATGARPAPKIDRLCFFFSNFVSECLKNEAQIARESIKKTRELPGLRASRS